MNAVQASSGQGSVPTLPGSVLVVGGGLAAYTFADQLRLRGYRGDLTLVAEQGLPYDLPPVSKEYLRGTMTRDEVDFRNQDFYVERGIRLIRGRVTGLELGSGKGTEVNDAPVRAVIGVDGEDNRDSEAVGEVAVEADVVVLATGARPVSARGSKQGQSSERISTLRSLADADCVRSFLRPDASVVILGAGLIGAEAAAAAVEAGAEVTLVNRSAPAGARIYGLAAARALEDEHREHGVRVLTTVSVAERQAGERVEVELATGEVLLADLVIDAGGAVPADGLARVADVAVAQDATGGVLVNGAGRTSHPSVLAIGDVARPIDEAGTPMPWSGHWEAAMNSAEDAAAALLGQNAETRGTAWFWSDRYGHHVEVVGHPALADAAGGLSIERRDGRGLRAIFSCRAVPASADARAEAVAGDGAEAPSPASPRSVTSAGAAGGADATEAASSGTAPAPQGEAAAEEETGVGQVVVLGAVTFDDARLARAARRLINRAKPVDAARLSDPDVSARELLRP